MPFKIRLKKTKRYDVSTKNSFVASVQLLDNTILGCTLGAETTGLECLENVAQRIGLGELKYFGLRFVNKKLKFRWVDLSKPLKRQIDKYASSPLLYFSVMFYLSEPHKLQDDMTRYQYFLQLKSDVIDGRLPCTADQAILLAGYSVQVVFGEHDPEKHSPDFLKEFVLLPRTLTVEETALDELTHEVVVAHSNLLGMNREIAELHYIVEAMQLDGYGMEFYAVKDADGADLYLGTSSIGLCARHLDGQPPTWYKWNDITNISHNKRALTIEHNQNLSRSESSIDDLSPETTTTTTTSSQVSHFYFEDPETTKYTWKMCSLHHRFFRCSDDGDVLYSDDELNDLTATKSEIDLRDLNSPTEGSQDQFPTAIIFPQDDGASLDGTASFPYPNYDWSHQRRDNRLTSYPPVEQKIQQPPQQPTQQPPQQPSQQPLEQRPRLSLASTPSSQQQQQEQQQQLHQIGLTYASSPETRETGADPFAAQFSSFDSPREEAPAEEGLPPEGANHRPAGNHPTNHLPHHPEQLIDHHHFLHRRLEPVNPQAHIGSSLQQQQQQQQHQQIISASSSAASLPSSASSLSLSSQQQQQQLHQHQPRQQSANFRPSLPLGQVNGIPYPLSPSHSNNSLCGSQTLLLPSTSHSQQQSQQPPLLQQSQQPPLLQQQHRHLGSIFAQRVPEYRLTPDYESVQRHRHLYNLSSSRSSHITDSDDSNLHFQPSSFGVVSGELSSTPSDGEPSGGSHPHLCPYPSLTPNQAARVTYPLVANQAAASSTPLHEPAASTNQLHQPSTNQLHQPSTNQLHHSLTSSANQQLTFLHFSPHLTQSSPGVPQSQIQSIRTIPNRNPPPYPGTGGGGHVSSSANHIASSNHVPPLTNQGASIQVGGALMNIGNGLSNGFEDVRLLGSSVTAGATGYVPIIHSGAGFVAAPHAAFDAPHAGALLPRVGDRPASLIIQPTFLKADNRHRQTLPDLQSQGLPREYTQSESMLQEAFLHQSPGLVVGGHAPLEANLDFGRDFPGDPGVALSPRDDPQTRLQGTQAQPRPAHLQPHLQRQNAPFCAPRGGGVVASYSVPDLHSAALRPKDEVDEDRTRTSRHKSVTRLTNEEEDHIYDTPPDASFDSRQSPRPPGIPPSASQPLAHSSHPQQPRLPQPANLLDQRQRLEANPGAENLNHLLENLSAIGVDDGVGVAGDRLEGWPDACRSSPNGLVDGRDSTASNQAFRVHETLGDADFFDPRAPAKPPRLGVDNEDALGAIENPLYSSDDDDVVVGVSRRTNGDRHRSSGAKTEGDSGLEVDAHISYAAPSSGDPASMIGQLCRGEPAERLELLLAGGKEKLEEKPARVSPTGDSSVSPNDSLGSPDDQEKSVISQETGYQTDSEKGDPSSCHRGPRQQPPQPQQRKKKAARSREQPETIATTTASSSSSSSPDKLQSCKSSPSSSHSKALNQLQAVLNAADGPGDSSSDEATSAAVATPSPTGARHAPGGRAAPPLPLRRRDADNETIQCLDLSKIDELYGVNGQAAMGAGDPSATPPTTTPPPPRNSLPTLDGADSPGSEPRESPRSEIRNTVSSPAMLNQSAEIESVGSSPSAGGGAGVDGEKESRRHDNERNDKRDTAYGTDEEREEEEEEEEENGKSYSWGPMKMAAMNGLALTTPEALSVLSGPDKRAPPTDERIRELENKIKGGQVFAEFEKIPRKRPNMLMDVTTASAEENESRNRFKDVLPYEDTRVKLKPTGSNPAGYVNASHIQVQYQDVSLRYIAAQAPMGNTVASWWALIWENDVRIIAMLTDVGGQSPSTYSAKPTKPTSPIGSSRSFPYFPDTVGNKSKLKFGEFHVSLQLCNAAPSYVTRCLLVKNVKSKEERKVWHLQLTEWPDHGCPEDVHSFLAYIEELESIRRHVASEAQTTKSRQSATRSNSNQSEKRSTLTTGASLFGGRGSSGSRKSDPISPPKSPTQSADAPPPPTLVHCTAGVGRTGVLILTEVMMACLEQNLKIDVPKALLYIRQQRMLMVQTLGQYSFVYKALIQHLRNSRLI